jgi:hypothetical protein
MSDNIYIIRVEGGTEEMLDEFAETMDGLEFSDNIIITNGEVEPVSHDEAIEYFEAIANAIDAEVIFDEGADKDG